MTLHFMLVCSFLTVPGSSQSKGVCWGHLFLLEVIVQYGQSSNGSMVNDLNEPVIKCRKFCPCHNFQRCTKLLYWEDLIEFKILVNCKQKIMIVSDLVGCLDDGDGCGKDRRSYWIHQVFKDRMMTKWSQKKWFVVNLVFQTGITVFEVMTLQLCWTTSPVWVSQLLWFYLAELEFWVIVEITKVTLDICLWI